MVVDLSGYRAPRRAMDRRALVVWSLSCVVLVTLCFLFADRPLATWSHDTLHRPKFAVVITELDAAWWTTGLALAVLLAALALRLMGRTLPAGARIAVGAASATLLATLGVVLLKYAFGRLWPETWVHGNPSWIGMHQYGFVPFHGGQGYGSFPSGHTARITAPCAVLWQRVPKLRALWLLPPAIVAAALIACDYHFLGGCIAGAYLGAASAAAVLLLI